MTNKLVAVTGATGFVGRSIIATLRMKGYSVREITRNRPGLSSVAVGEIGPNTDWSRALAGVSCVIHAAARVHITHDNSVNPLELYRIINVKGTTRLANQALLAGVRRIVFVSSVKVNGERTKLGAPFDAEGMPSPEDAYGLSKFEAEQALSKIAISTGLEVVVVRPPLVYGPGVKANFAQLISAVRCGIPLPFSGITNQRSFVGIDNLVDLLLVCTEHPLAPGRKFMVSDGNDLSTPELVTKLAGLLRRSPRLFPMPRLLLSLGGRLTGRISVIERLTESLQVNIQPTINTLGWTPRVSVDEGLARTLANFNII